MGKWIFISIIIYLIVSIIVFRQLQKEDRECELMHEFDLKDLLWINIAVAFIPIINVFCLIEIVIALIKEYGNKRKDSK